MAKSAGIDGFIVSWKSTPALNRRLQRLVKVADVEQFKLCIIYQGLDFHRHPLPAGRIAADLRYFSARFAPDVAFHAFPHPVVIWSGTWKFSRAQVASVTGKVRPQLMVLASEHNLHMYQRIADLMDGNAYYWSSVDPYTFPGYQHKLDAFAQGVHARRGLWVAPSAPGFDGRLIGGHRVVDRKGGDTLRREMDVALNSSPDIVGIISWNEFSEGTYIEPSRNYGGKYLKVLSNILSAPIPRIADFDSSDPGSGSQNYGLGLLAAMVLLALVSVAVVVRRASRGR